MSKFLFDFDDDDFAFRVSDNMAMDSDGDLLLRMTDTMALDLDSGDIHLTLYGRKTKKIYGMTICLTMINGMILVI